MSIARISPMTPSSFLVAVDWDRFLLNEPHPEISPQPLKIMPQLYHKARRLSFLNAKR
jgi:hypothetical protein